MSRPIASPAALASSIASLLAESPEAKRNRGAGLRAAVVTHHGLGRLMPRLLQIMSSEVAG
jgi:hypothetical protein